MESLQARAEQHLQVIRAAMERAASFTALPGWGGVIMGAVGLIGALAAARMTDPRQWVLVWLFAAGVAVPVGAFTMWRKASRAGVDLYSGTARMFVERQAYAALPAVWLTLYGTAAVVGGVFSVRLVPMMGVAFMVLGGLAAFAPLAVGNALMGVGFGLLHGVVGLVIVRRFGG